MAKLIIGLCTLCISYSTALEVPFLVLRSSYSDELKAASIAFRTEVESIINKSQTLVAECNDLIETLQYSAGSLQEEVSDIVNDTLTEFGKDVNKLITDVSIDVSECTALSFTFESRATDILVDTNTCVYDKLNDANTLTDETISAIQYTMARMFSIKKIVDDNLNASMINQGKMTVPQALIFLKEISSELDNVAYEISSFSTTTRLGILQINSQMILDCVSDETIASLINDSRVVYSKIKNCITKLDPLDTNRIPNDL